METIKEAKEMLKENWGYGVKCPCCNQFVKLYKRKINVTQVRGLANLVRLFNRDGSYHHVTEIGVVAAGGEFARLERFGLINQLKNEDPAKKTSGMWKPTQSGIDFISNKVAIPKFCQMYNGKIYGFSEAKIQITDVIENFNYEELMSNHNDGE